MSQVIDEASNEDGMRDDKNCDVIGHDIPQCLSDEEVASWIDRNANDNDMLITENCSTFQAHEKSSDDFDNSRSLCCESSNVNLAQANSDVTNHTDYDTMKKS